MPTAAPTCPEFPLPRRTWSETESDQRPPMTTAPARGRSRGRSISGTGSRRSSRRSRPGRTAVCSEAAGRHCSAALRKPTDSVASASRSPLVGPSSGPVSGSTCMLTSLPSWPGMRLPLWESGPPPHTLSTTPRPCGPGRRQSLATLRSPHPSATLCTITLRQGTHNPLQQSKWYAGNTRGAAARRRRPLQRTPIWV